MITIICTTNRPDSNTRKVASEYQSALENRGEKCQILDLKEVDSEWIQASNYGDNSPEFDHVVRKYIQSTQKIIFITPEYNGSFPGYLKFFMDACGHGDWADKRTALMGLASGRAGNVRGLDHLTGILHYLGSEVFSKKVYLSQINNSLDSEGNIRDEILTKEIDAQLEGFLKF